MPELIKLFLKPSIFEEEKELILHPEFIKFGELNFSKFEISQLRYGIKSINGYRFRIGRVYVIDIKNISGDIIKIRLKSLYRIRKNHLGTKYIKILHTIFENYVDDICNGYINHFLNKEEFVLLGQTFKQDGILLDKKNEFISWEDLGTKNYNTYYSIFSKSNPHINRLFYYLTDWNTIVFYSVSRTILQSKGI